MTHPLILCWLPLLLCFTGCGPSASGIFPRKVDQRLAEAAARGDITAINRALDAGANLNAIGTKGKQPLQFAFDHKNKAGFEYLLKRGADPNIPDAWGQCVINYAAKKWKDSEWLSIVMKHGGDPNVRQKLSMLGIIRGETPIYDAITARSVKNVEILVSGGADINVVDSQRGYSPVLQASTFRDPVMVQWLIEHGADWSKQDIEGTSVAEAEIRHEYDPQRFPEAAAAHQWVLDFLEKQGVDLKEAEKRSRAIYGVNFRRIETKDVKQK